MSSAENKMSLDDWELGSLRLSVFYRPEEGFDHSGWWKQLFGDVADSKDSMEKRDRTLYSSVIEDWRYELDVTQSRSDLRVALTPQAMAGMNVFPTLGPLTKTEPDLLDLCKKLISLESMPTISRLAFGPVYFHPVAQKVDAYKLLDSMTSVCIDVEHSRGFNYQINRWRKSKLSDCTVNRITKWMCQTVLSGEISHKDGAQTNTREWRAARLELDINTAAEFPGAFTSDGFSELVEMAHEICEYGDIP